MRFLLYTLVTASALSPFVAAHMDMIKRTLAASLHWNLQTLSIYFYSTSVSVKGQFKCSPSQHRLFHDKPTQAGRLRLPLQGGSLA